MNVSALTQVALLMDLYFSCVIVIMIIIITRSFHLMTKALQLQFASQKNPEAVLYIHSSGYHYKASVNVDYWRGPQTNVL